jgi:TonB family protein
MAAADKENAMINLSGRERTALARAPFAASVALHLAAVVALAYASQANVSQPRPQFTPAKTAFVYVPVVPVEITTTKLAELRAPEPVRAEEAAPPRLMPEVAPIFESRRVEVIKPIELPTEPPPAPTPASPAPRSPVVAVGTFANPAAPVRTPEPAKQIEIAGFDRAPKQATELKPSTTTVGAFDRQVAANPRTDTPQPTATADAGFNRSAVVVSAAPEGTIVRDTGFGNTNSREKPRAADPAPQVASVLFDNARAAQSLSRPDAPPSKPRVLPVEVLSKPVPMYTEEARRLRIEGDVLLEVEFRSTGAIRVLRVVRGLGHGLDEAAVRAAEQIRFKPALDSGQAVDSRTTVNIVFRLA